jgi:hypothetical protein
MGISIELLNTFCFLAVIKREERIMNKNQRKKVAGAHQTTFPKCKKNRKIKRPLYDPALLQSPLEYYTGKFPGLAAKSGWVTVVCCFHRDKTPSLSINLDKGCFVCHACGVKGGDILSFHMQYHKLGFIEAVTELGAWKK